MITHRRQSGMSILGIICILAMLGFFAMCIIRMSPPYFEYLSVKDIIVRIATEPETIGKSSSDIRRKIDFVFNTNQIYELNYKDVKVFDKSGKKYIDANYEVRIPIMWKIDAVLKFNDLLYQVGGDGRPVTNFPPTKK
jgi:hypothetical protein